MPRSPDLDAVLATIHDIASVPTAPYHEAGAIGAIRSLLSSERIDLRDDEYGQLFAGSRRAGACRTLALVAHTDHSGFEVVSADGNEGIARVLGGFRGPIDAPTSVRVYSDAQDGPPLLATVDRFVPEIDPIHHSPGRVRIRADGLLAPGQWAVLDLPGLEIEDDELHMAAADDLAGCAVVVCALREIARSDSTTDLMGIFTRAEETGLYGSRIVAEEAEIPRDAIVVSVEASRALPSTPPGGGIVVRVGDRYNTFSNDGERFLRAAAEHIAREGIRSQRALLDGGMCEASTFMTRGWDATAVALPNVNYHNRAADGRLVPEVVRLTDIRAGIALLVEAARLAGRGPLRPEPAIDPVPADVKRRLRRART